MKVSHLLGGAAVAALMVGFTTVAYAQSTGTQEVEKVTVTGERSGKGGLIVKEQRPKSRSTVTGEYLDTQPGGQTIFQSINLLPGVVFTNSDPYGSSGGDTKLRGMDRQRIFTSVDGVPLPDSGNYDIFSNQYVDPEFLSRVTVNTGTTDVDSATAAATGGTINIVTRKPFKDMTLSMNGGVGSWDYTRFMAAFDTGEYRGVSAFAGVSFQEYDKFKGPGKLEKTQGNARIYQVIGENSFISVIGHYNENRNNFYRTLSLAEINTNGRWYDNFTSCTRGAPSLGVVDLDGASPNAGGTENILNPSSCTNYYNLRINPSNTGNIRAQANLQLSDTVRLTFDPSWQYVKANGGGTNVISESDTRLGTGIDLNGDEAFNALAVDQVRLYTPNNTNTSRYGVTTSVIWQPSDNDTLRVAYTGDHARHRQTGVFSRLDASGNPRDVFSGLDQRSLEIVGTDGNVLRGRDRLSHAILNQVAASYTGRFLDGALLVDAGITGKFFERDLNNFCYSQVGSAFNVRCTKETFTDADGDGIGTLASQGATNFIAPLTANLTYDAWLPNVGASYELDAQNIVFASYAETFRVPGTDSLYTFGISTGTGTESGAIDEVVSLSVEPEKAQTIDVGYRFQGETVTASMSLWHTKWDNRTLSAFDPDLGFSVDRNVGAVTMKGFDAELGWKAMDNLLLYASTSYNQSRIEEDLPLSATQLLPIKGKELVGTPEWTGSLRGVYDVNQNVRVGLQGKYTGARWATDVNDEKAKAFVTFDADVQVDLESIGLGDMMLQMNAINLLDEEYLGSISSTQNAVAIVDVDPITPGNQGKAAGTVRYQIGSPQTFQIQLKTKF